jgi:hypothetical protein
MNHPDTTLAFWSTASFSHTGEPLPDELQMLGQHLGLCRRSHGHWFALQCFAQSTNGFVRARLITSLMVAVLVAGLVSLLF